MSNFNDLIHYAQAKMNGWTDDYSKEVISRFGDMVDEGNNYEEDIRPPHIGTVRHFIESFGVSILDDDIDGLVRLSQSDPVLFRLMYDTLLLSKSTLDGNMPEGWADQYYVSYMKLSDMETNGEIAQFMIDTCLYAPDDAAKAKAFNDFWDRYYDSVVVVNIQYKKKEVFASTQPIIYYSLCSSIKKEDFVQKAFLTVGNVNVA